MRTLPFALVVIAVLVPTELALGQAEGWAPLERTFRPHVPRGGIGVLHSNSAPPKKVFSVGGVEYATWLTADAIESSPDWLASQPVPVEFSLLEQAARQALGKVVTNASPWCIRSFQLQSFPGRQSLKWYFLVELRPFWDPESAVAHQTDETFWLAVDFSGKPGLLGRNDGENRLQILR